MSVIYGVDSEFVATVPGVVLETHFELMGEPANHPIEAGSTITDHVTDDPDKATVRLHVSPVVLVGTAQNTQEVFALLVRIKEEKILCSVSSDVNTLTDAGLVHIQVPRDLQSGTSMVVDLEFQKIQVVQTRTTTAPRIMRPLRHQGATTTTTPTAPQQTLAHQIAHDVPRLFSSITGG